MTVATRPTRQEYEKITFSTPTPNVQRPSRQEYEKSIQPMQVSHGPGDEFLRSVVPEQSQQRQDPGVYGAFDVWAAPPDSEIWKSPGAKFTGEFGAGWLEQTRVPALAGKKFAPPKTTAGKIGRVAGQMSEAISELVILRKVLGGVGVLSKTIPKGATVFEKAAQVGGLFFAQELTDEARKRTAEAIYNEDFGSRGGMGAIEAFQIGATLSLAGSGLRGIWNKLKPNEQAQMLKTLGLKKGATLQEINRAARIQSRKFHPDKVKGMRENFDKVINARDALRKMKAGDIIKAGGKRNFVNNLQKEMGVSRGVAENALKRLEAGESIQKVDQMLSQAKFGIKPLITAPPKAVTEADIRPARQSYEKSITKPTKVSLKTSDKGAFVEIESIEAKPTGTGAGTKALQELIDTTDKPIRLTVAKSNKKAQALYKKLGFTEITPEDPKVTGIRMEFKPEAAGKLEGKRTKPLTEEEVNLTIKERVSGPEYQMYLEDKIQAETTGNQESATRAFDTEAEVLFEQGYLYNEKRSQWERVSAGFKAEVEAAKATPTPQEAKQPTEIDKKLINNWLPKIKTKLSEQEVKNLSDAELKRAFKGTAAENRLIEYSKIMRESGDLKYEDITISQPTVETKKPAEVEAPKKMKGRPGKLDVTELAKVHKAFMSIVEPSKAVEIKLGKEPYAAVIKGIHQADVGRIEFNEAQIEGQDKSLNQMSQWFNKFSDKELKNFMTARGVPKTPEAQRIQRKAISELPKDLRKGELFNAVQRVADSNYKYLQSVVGDDINRVEDYFYGIYKNPKKVEKFLDYWKTTKRYTKEKKLPTVADAINYGLELKNWNPIENLKAEYVAISHLEGMNWMRDELLRTGKGKFIDDVLEAPLEWDKVSDPVFKDLRMQPDLAKMINNLIATNKISRIPSLNALREINNLTRTVKFVGSAFHLLSVAKQSVADSGYLGFLYKKTATRGLTRGFRQNDPTFRTTAYKDYIKHGGGHRYSVESEARRAFTRQVDKLNRNMGVAVKVGALPLKIPTGFVNWMFQSYIPKVKYAKFLDVVAEKEKKFNRKLTSPEKIDIIKEQQNFYGMMNERLFGRSGTVTSAMRFYFMSPGYAEGNYRTMQQAATQWGGKAGHKANRSRSNIINSWILSAAAATAATLAFTGKPPEKPENMDEFRDIFKIDTGKKDEIGQKIMIDMLTYDKDYFNVAFNLLRLRPDIAIGKSWKRLGGMKAPTAEIIHDLVGMAMGKAVVDWKNQRIFHITDPFLTKVMKLTNHEIKKLTPISVSVFQQSRKREIDKTTAAVETLLGLRPTKSESDITARLYKNKMHSLVGQREILSYEIGRSTDPKESVKLYNKTVNSVLNSPYITESMKKEWEHLLIDYDKVVTWKRFPAGKMTKPEMQRAYDAHTLSVPYRRRGEPIRLIGAPKKGSEKRVEQLEAEAKKRGYKLQRGPRVKGRAK